MPRPKNPFFRFQQFTVWHDQCALKVCTEACILGSYVPVSTAQKVLDVGTGTGLLALMMAQRNPHLSIDAIEIDEASARQAVQNISQSPFSEQIRVEKSAIQTWQAASFGYDLIVSNPPFFANHLRASDAARNRALHTETLSLEDLATAINKFLAANGHFVVLLPPYQTQQLTDILADLSLYPAVQLQVFQQPQKPMFRQITTFIRNKVACTTQTLYIHEANGGYSEAFRELLKDYYLIF
ncbi:MAG: methyltransferase [Spirosomaceae bacterium]|nr:methyltransferase [Spirosomataceae bacterium]